MGLDKKLWQWLLLMALAFTWGTSFILMKRGLESFTYIQVAELRVFFSFLILLPVAIKSLNKIQRNNIKSLFIAGFIGNGIPAFLFTKAQTQISSSLAGMLNALTPIFTFMVGFLIYKTKAGFISLVGLIVGFIGSVLLIFYGGTDFFSGNNWYGLLILLACLFYGINLNEIKLRLGDLSGLEITAIAFFIVGPFAGIGLLFSDFSIVNLDHKALINLGYVALLALFCSVLALIAFYSLAKHTTALFASSVTYVIPIFAIFWGLLDGEKILWYQVLFMTIIILGVYLVNYKSKK